MFTITARYNYLTGTIDSKGCMDRPHPRQYKNTTKLWKWNHKDKLIKFDFGS